MPSRLHSLALLLTAAIGAPVFADTISVTDDLDNTITLDAPAQRIVTLIPHATELLFEVGAGDQIVGASEYSNYPKAAQDIPRVGDVYSLNLEKILSLQPDLILVWESSNIAGPLQTLSDLDIPLYYTDPQSFDAIQKTLRDFGQLTGNAESADAAAVAFAGGMADLAADYAEKSAIRTFYQVWHDPIVTLSDRNFLGDVFATCGGRNIFADEDIIAPQVGLESVVSANPEVIIAGASDGTGLQIWEDLSEISAVANGHLYTVDPDYTSRPTSSLLQGAEEICAAIDRAR